MAALARPLTLLTLLLTTLFTLAAPGCDDQTSAKTLSVNIGGRKFLLEVADTYDVRLRGLGGRDKIAPDGGMLFLFPDSGFAVQTFVMRDCAIPIDIIYLDRGGRVLATYTMAPEPRNPDGSEGKDKEINQKYEDRLKRYSSKYPSQFVIELAGHTLDTLKVKEGDKIDLDWEALRRRAR